VLHPLTTDVSGAAVLLKVTAREGLIQFLNPREKARAKVAHALRERLLQSKTFRSVRYDGPAELVLQVQITEYVRPKGHSDDAICKLDVRLMRSSEPQIVAHVTSLGRSSHNASKSDWRQAEARAIEIAIDGAADYLESVRLAEHAR
jgi:hypothetical protein